MVDTAKLKGEIIAHNMKVSDVYTAMGLTKRQWQTRMENKKLDSDDILKLIVILALNSWEQIKAIFFVEKDT